MKEQNRESFLKPQNKFIKLFFSFALLFVSTSSALAEGGIFATEMLNTAVGTLVGMDQENAKNTYYYGAAANAALGTYQYKKCAAANKPVPVGNNSSSSDTPEPEPCWAGHMSMMQVLINIAAAQSIEDPEDETASSNGEGVCSNGATNYPSCTETDCSPGSPNYPACRQASSTDCSILIDDNCPNGLKAAEAFRTAGVPLPKEIFKQLKEEGITVNPKDQTITDANGEVLTAADIAAKIKLTPNSIAGNDNGGGSQRGSAYFASLPPHVRRGLETKMARVQRSLGVKSSPRSGSYDAQRISAQGSEKKARQKYTNPFSHLLNEKKSTPAARGLKGKTRVLAGGIILGADSDNLFRMVREKYQEKREQKLFNEEIEKGYKY